ncbi:MAG: head GIN domain-containing protein [Ginsengibacter sp.]
MKSFVFFFLIALTTPSFAQTIIHDENAEVRNVPAFSGIKVSGGIDIYLSQSEDYALAVSASDQKFRDGIKTEVNNGILIISYDGGNFRLNANRKLRVYTSFNKLVSLEASGASRLIFSNMFEASSVKMELSDASEIRGTVDISNLVLNISGASTVKVSGNVKNLKLNASGASDVKNYSLIADNCVAELSGASDVRITVNESLSARATGASTLYYKGNPQKSDINSSGASNVSQKNP